MSAGVAVVAVAAAAAAAAAVAAAVSNFVGSVAAAFAVTSPRLEVLASQWPR